MSSRVLVSLHASCRVASGNALIFLWAGCLFADQRRHCQVIKQAVIATLCLVRAHALLYLEFRTLCYQLSC